MSKCRTKNCRGQITKSGRSHYCSKCRSRRWRDKFPLHYSFKNLRVRAIQRGKEFTLTREQYVEFAVKTDYGRLKGKTSLSLSLDRIDDTRGYTKDNIQAITLRENSRKQFVPYFQQYKERTMLETQKQIGKAFGLTLLQTPA
jgi:hypothetical protein